MARLLAEAPRGEPFELGRTLQHLITRTTGQVWAGNEPEIDRMVLRMGRYPEHTASSTCFRCRPLCASSSIGAAAAPASPRITSCSTG